jgi:transcription antitermination factor NusA-like protein
VNTPLCSICLKNFPLVCGNCQAKIKSGEVTELGVKVARYLVNLEDKIPALKDVTFRRALQTDGLVVVLVGHGDVRRIVGASRRISRQLEDELHTPVRIVEESRSAQHILADLLRPVRILGINTTWLPDNSFERKVRISPRDQSQIPIGLEQLEKLVYELSGERIRIGFD